MDESGNGDLPRRVAWWLVWAYPPRFRREVGQGLVDALDDRMRARRAAGAASATIWARAIADTLRNATAEWIDALRAAAVRRSSFDVRRSSSAFDVRRSGSAFGCTTLDERRTTNRERRTTNRERRTTNDEPRTSNGERRRFMDALLQDVRYASRLWRRRPGFAFVAILTLALGIGANTAMFSIVNAVLLRPMPYAHGDRLANLWARTPARPQSLLSWDEYLAFREQKESFDAVALWLGQSVNLTAVTEPQRIVGVFATGSFFDVLEVTAERGRFFGEEESAPGTAKPVVVISHQFWQRHFASDPSAIGATL